MHVCVHTHADTTIPITLEPLSLYLYLYLSLYWTQFRKMPLGFWNTLLIYSQFWFLSGVRWDRHVLAVFLAAFNNCTCEFISGRGNYFSMRMRSESLSWAGVATMLTQYLNSLVPWIWRKPVSPPTQPDRFFPDVAWVLHKEEEISGNIFQQAMPWERTFCFLLALILFKKDCLASLDILSSLSGSLSNPFSSGSLPSYGSGWLFKCLVCWK